MNAEIFNEKIQELVNTIDSYYNPGENNEVMYTFFIIKLYSIWETSIKDMVYSLFKENSKIVHNSRFSFQYLDSIFSTSHLKKVLKNNFASGDFEVKKEYITSSNNVNLKVAKSLLETLGIDTNKFNAEFIVNEEFNEIIRDLEELDIIPSTSSIRMNEVEKIEGYINLIVEKRNEISHVYKLQERVYSKNEMFKLITLFKAVFACILGSSKFQMVSLASEKGMLDANIVDLSMIASKRAKTKNVRVRGKIIKAINAIEMILINNIEVKCILELTKVIDYNSGEELTLGELVINNYYDFLFVDKTNKSISKDKICYMSLSSKSGNYASEIKILESNM